MMEKKIDLNFTIVNNSHNDIYFKEVNSVVFRKNSSVFLYDSQFSSKFAHKNKFYIILGTDSGLLCRYIENKCLDESNRYLFVENSEVLSHLIEYKLLAINNEKLKFCSFNEWEETAKGLLLAQYISLNQVMIIKSLSVVDSVYLNYINEVEAFIQQYKAFNWRVAIPFASRLLLIQQLHNVSENRIPAICLKNSFCNKTAIVLGGGPSLDNILSWVEQYRSSLLVIAVSRICRRLLETAIQPDIIVAIDPTDKMFDVSKDMFQFADKSLFVNSNHVSSELLASWPGKKVYLGDRLPGYSDFNLANVISQGPTVTNAAIELLIVMGFTQILLAGVDLCYSSEGYSHARGSIEFEKGPNLSYTGLTVTTYDGCVVETDPAFFTAIKTLKDQAELAVSKGVKLVNLSKKAANIDNIPYLAAENIVLNKEELIAGIIIDETIKNYRPVTERVHYQKGIEAIKKQIFIYKKISKLATEGKFLNNFFGENTKKKHISKLEKIENQLNKKYSTHSKVLTTYFHHYFVDVYKTTTRSTLTIDDIKKGTEVYLSAYISATKDLINLLRNSMQQFEFCLEEITSSPNMKKLINYWAQKNQAGHAWLWVRTNNDKYCSLEQDLKSQLDQLVNFFDSKLVNRENSDTSKMLSLDKIKLLQRKLFELFKLNQTERLRKMINEIEKIDSEHTKALIQLAEGYINEIEDAPVKAAKNYYAGATGPIKEMALNHLASILIKMNNIENALLALQSLCCLSNAYLPHYAQLCETTGLFTEAIGAYEAYLQSNPHSNLIAAKLNSLKRVS